MILTQTSSNIDYLIPALRLYYGDIDGTKYSDTIYRSALLAAIRFIQRKVDYKYQIFTEQLLLDPQPVDTPDGMVAVASVHGDTYVSNTLTENDVFRDPFGTFTQSVPLIETVDELGILYVAAYLTRKVQITSDIGTFRSWATEDLRFSNLGTQTLLTTLLEQDIKNVNSIFGTDTIKPEVIGFRRIRSYGRNN